MQIVGDMMTWQPGFIKPCIYISRENANIAKPIQSVISTWKWDTMATYAVGKQ
jgi:hypothetical protein